MTLTPAYREELEALMSAEYRKELAAYTDQELIRHVQFMRGINRMSDAEWRKLFKTAATEMPSGDGWSLI